MSQRRSGGLENASNAQNTRIFARSDHSQWIKSSLKARVVQSDLLPSRRNLPHWELGGSTYFLTYRCSKSITLDGPSRSIVLENWRYWHGKRYLLHAVVVMPDHVHVLITPKSEGKGSWFSLQNILHTNKGYTAHEINKHRGGNVRIWQDERFDRIVRDANEFFEKWTYIANNPVKSGLVQSAETYQWLYQNPGAWQTEKSPGQRPEPPKDRKS